MMMPDDNHLSLAGFRRRQPVGVGLSTGLTPCTGRVVSRWF
jgi:hypothetical protein